MALCNSVSVSVCVSVAICLYTAVWSGVEEELGLKGATVTDVSRSSANEDRESVS